MCCRARRRSSVTSERKGFSLIQITPSYITPTVSPPEAAPFGTATTAPVDLPPPHRHPGRLHEDVQPDEHHRHVEEDRVQERVAAANREDQPDHRANRDDGDRNRPSGDGADEWEDGQPQ